MAYCDRASLADYLSNFAGQDPLKVIVCPFAQDAGAGMGMPLFAMGLFGFIGLGLTIRTQHPGPIVVAGILSASVVALRLPGNAALVLSVALFFAIGGFALYIYQRAQTSL